MTFGYENKREHFIKYQMRWYHDHPGYRARQNEQKKAKYHVKKEFRRFLNILIDDIKEN